MEEKTINQVEENMLVCNYEEDVLDMSKIYDFPSSHVDETEADTPAVDQKIVNDLFNAFMVPPSSVVVRLKNKDGYLKMIVDLLQRRRFYRRFETYADTKLIECVMGSMVGNKLGALKAYKAAEHPLKACPRDPRISVFRQLITSEKMSCHFDTDFITSEGTRYMCASFPVSFHKEIRICLPRTKEIEAIIDEAFNAK